MVDNGPVKNVTPVEECCQQPVLQAPLDELQAERMADAFRVVGDAARLRILSLISSKDPEESWVGELTEALGLSQPTVSHHLRVLLDAGLIEREARGNRTYYSLACDQIELLHRSLAPKKDALRRKRGRA
jgi:ArsR family transcriptional regulator